VPNVISDVKCMILILKTNAGVVAASAAGDLNSFVVWLRAGGELRSHFAIVNDTKNKMFLENTVYGIRLKKFFSSWGLEAVENRISCLGNESFIPPDTFLDIEIEHSLKHLAVVRLYRYNEQKDFYNERELDVFLY